MEVDRDQPTAEAGAEGAEPMDTRTAGTAATTGTTGTIGATGMEIEPAMGEGAAAGAAMDTGAADTDTEAAAPAVEPDERLEGTTAYLAPELMKGAHPSVESDVWALGCVIFQMLVGRPPLWADSAGEMMQRIVHFEPEQLPAFPPGVSETAKGLVLSLLVRAPDRRLGGGGSGVGAVFGHAFFAGLPPLDRLYQTTPPTLDGGVVAPAPNAAWARRQNSVMWSPLPSSYNFAEHTYKLEIIAETEVEADSIFGTRVRSAR